jgi:hypothetical protein
MLVARAFHGKSTLIGALLKALEEGTPFLGRQTMPATALLISEEDEYTLSSRLAVFGLPELGSEYVGRSGGVLASDWATLIAQASTRALDRGHSLLVVDTFAGLAGLQAKEENDAGAVGERLRPLQEAAGEGLAVLFLHHLNKMGQTRGSEAFRGVVDTEMRLYQGRNNTFSIKTVSRFATQFPPKLSGRLVKDRRGWFYEVREEAARPTWRRSGSPAGIRRESAGTARERKLTPITGLPRPRPDSVRCGRPIRSDKY